MFTVIYAETWMVRSSPKTLYSFYYGHRKDTDLFIALPEIERYDAEKVVKLCWYHVIVWKVCNFGTWKTWKIETFLHGTIYAKLVNLRILKRVTVHILHKTSSVAEISSPTWRRTHITAFKNLKEHYWAEMTFSSEKVLSICHSYAKKSSSNNLNMLQNRRRIVSSMDWNKSLRQKYRTLSANWYIETARG